MTVPSFYKISESPPAEVEKCLIYGSAKVGKTALFGTLGSRTLMINTGAGMETLKSPWFKSKCPGVDPMVVDIKEHMTTRGEITEATAYDATCDAIDYALANFNSEIDNIVVDDMTALRSYAMNKASEYALATGIVKQKFKEMKSAKDDPEKMAKVFTEVAEWQGEMNLVYKFIAQAISQCESAKKNIFFGAHEKYVYALPKDERTGKAIIGAQPDIIKCYPAFTGKQYPDQVQAMFDDVWHLELAGKEADSTRRLRIRGGVTSDFGLVMAGTRHDGVFKDRKGEFADYIENPNLTSMLEQIKNAKGAK